MEKIKTGDNERISDSADNPGACFQCGRCCKDHVILITFFDIISILKRMIKADDIRRVNMNNLIEIFAKYFTFYENNQEDNKETDVDKKREYSQKTDTDKEREDNQKTDTENNKESDIVSNSEADMIKHRNMVLDKYFTPLLFDDGDGIIRSGYFGLRFKKIRTRNNKIIRACVFLDLETNLCKIHQFKLLICKAYPHTLVIEQNKKTGKPEEIIIWNDARCPAPWLPSALNTSSEYEELKRFHRDAQNIYKEYREQIKEWNLKVKKKQYNGDLEDLINYILSLKFVNNQQ